MKVVCEIAEAAAVVLTLGVAILLGVAALVHWIFDEPEPRANLTTPPISLLCPDAAGHCEVRK